ncbi:replication initiator protein A [Mammaliicoccus sciuri]|uniref:replication initiator protein A n=1 Tax=Mammaliicoccus sciuri TaxID=1296 RepID=UPI00265C2A3B|nr:replication initiator protein A [Mammaliicoccus sciuri]MDO0952905.1 replication initiator protein A [Mammaliicoccus sciuri]
MSRKNVNNQASQNFYILHKALFINEKYKKLSDSSKIGYAVLNDRVSLSIKNNWIDQNGDIYFIFTNENLQEVLGKSKNTITKIKKELEEVGLLEQVKTGFNRPNKLYLHEIETNINVEKQIQKNTENNDELSNSKDSQSLGVQNPKVWESRTPKFGSPESQSLDSNDTELSNTKLNNTEYNDMNDLNDIEHKHNYHSDHSYQFVTESDDKDYKEILLQEFPEQLTNYLMNYHYKDLEVIKTVILKAKKSFNSRHEDMHYMLEDIEDEILISLKRVKKAIHDRGVKGQKETIISMQGYLMRTILSELEELYLADMRRQNMTKYNIFN